MFHNNHDNDLVHKGIFYGCPRAGSDWQRFHTLITVRSHVDLSLALVGRHTSHTCALTTSTTSTSPDSPIGS